MNREACCLQLGQLTGAKNHPLASGFTWERRLLHPTTTLRPSTNKLVTNQDKNIINLNFSTTKLSTIVQLNLVKHRFNKRIGNPMYFNKKDFSPHYHSKRLSMQWLTNVSNFTRQRIPHRRSNIVKRALCSNVKCVVSEKERDCFDGVYTHEEDHTGNKGCVREKGVTNS